MSNASNLSTLANVLDDGTSGQFLKSTGSGGVAFDTVAAGAVVYATADLLPLSGNSAGDMAYVTATNRFYINNGSGWYSVSLVNTNPNITSVQDASSNTAPFTLATDGTATVITVTAADPEEVPLTYGYSVTSGSLNGSTVTQGTGSNTNVFTVTPHASQDATFTLTFTASDGINQATSANAFSLSFVTVVTDSKYTTLLATATGTSDNNNITDSSSNSHSITVNGDAHAGTFSPYRSGGYSTYFNYGSYGSSTIGLRPKSTTEPDYGGSGDLTVELWIYPTIESNNNYTCLLDQRPYGSNGNYVMLRRDTDGKIRFHWDFGFRIDTSSNAAPANEWTHIAIVRSSGVFTMYINGSAQTTTYTNSGSNTNSSGSLSPYIGLQRDGNGPFWGYIRDLRFVSSSVYTQNFTPVEKLTAITGTTFLTCHKPYQLVYDTDSTTNVEMETYTHAVEAGSISPYDYAEYSAADHGGSVYFDGSGDVIYTPQDTAFNIGTDDFTFEAWVYPTLYTSNDWNTLFAIGNTTNFGGLLVGKSNTGSFVIRQYGTANVVATTNLPDLNAWTHIACVRSSGTSKLYYNGSEIATASDTTNYFSTTPFAHIGNSDHTTYSHYWNGYVSDARFISGTAVYSGEFTPPTGPLTTTGGTYASTTNVNTSITASNTSLLIKGTDASIIDKSQGSNLKLVGTTTGSTDEVRTGNWANTKTMKFDGNSDYLTFPHRQELNFASNDWTIECWIYPKTNVGYCGIWHQSASGTDWNSIYLNGSFNPKFVFYNSSNNVEWAGTAASNTAPQNTWTHLALVRKFGTGVYLFAGGTLVASDTNDTSVTMLDKTYDHVIGYERFVGNGTYFDGYIQDFRITNGLARYINAQNPTANFTPPTAPLEG